MNSNSNQFHVTMTSEGWLYLKVKDKNSKEYMDGSVVRVSHTAGVMIGVIRYSFGRFEILCTFKDQRFIFGLNPAHEILGHIADNDNTAALLESQASKPYASNG